MDYSIRYNGYAAGSFFGRFLQPGQSFLAGAGLAVELHNDKSGLWICPDVEKAKAELAAPAVEVIEVPAGISIDAVPPAGEVEIPASGTSELLPTLDSSIAAVPVVAPPVTSVQCDLCDETFPSKKKLAAHKTAVHTK